MLPSQLLVKSLSEWTYQCSLDQSEAPRGDPRMGASLRRLAREMVEILGISARAYQAPAAVDMNPDLM